MKKNLILATVSFLVGILLLGGIGEVITRSIYPYWTLDMALKYSPTLFAKHKIEAKSHTVHRRANPSDTIAINNLGYRGEPIQLEKPDTQVRILIYGGSQVFSAGTGSVGWPEQIERKLKEHGKGRVEVINGGTPGHASYDSLGRLYAYGHYLDPDVVVLNNTWNDMKYFHQTSPPLEEVKPYNPAKNPRRNYLNGFDRFLGRNSQFYVVLRSKYFTWRASWKNNNSGTPQKSDTVTRRALNQYRLTIKTFVDLARNIGAEPILMKQPRLLVEHPSPEQKTKIRYGNLNLQPEAILQAFREADQILQRIGNRTDTELWDFSEMNGKGKYFYDHVHLTPEGAQVLSEKISRNLRNEVLTSSGSNASTIGSRRK